jgi:UDP-N-acetylmuramyl pentapeptide phosphotransferase/UDP-N-acetylglucosamine-1-phosphate transferase
MMLSHLTVGYITIFAASLVLALIGTPVVRALATRAGVVSNPDARRVHARPTPLLGGIAIFIAALASLVIFGKGSEYGHGLGMLIGVALIVLVGFLDDLYHIPALVKLSGQIVAAIVIIPFGISVEISGAPWLDAILTVGWVVGVTNAFNLIDNMDGLSAGIAAIASFSIFAIAAHVGQYLVAATSLALCGACLGFLRYNFGRMPARIFMGDTGSLFLGYLLAVLAVRLSYGSARLVTPFIPIAILGLPIFDTSFVIVRRLREGRSIFQAGKDHTSHQLAAALHLSTREAVILLLLTGAVLGAGAIFAVTRLPLAGGIGGIILVTLMITFMTLKDRPVFDLVEAEPAPVSSMEGKQALAVLPTYNEIENIVSLANELLALPVPLQVLVVDDNSPDGTAAAVQAEMQNQPRLHLLSRPGKLGLGTAYMAGFNYGLENNYDFIITMDADFSHHPKYLPSMLAKATEDNCDLVIGSRYVPGGGVANWPWHRQMLSRTANMLTRAALRLSVHDCTSGYRCYRRQALGKIAWHDIRANGYAFLEEMLFRASLAGCRIGESPIIFTDRRAGSSKISKSEIWRAMTTLLRLRRERLRLRNQPAPAGQTDSQHVDSQAK